MPISEKITTAIEKLKAKPDEKKLMLDILKLQDQGCFRYKSEYSKLVKTYIENMQGVKKK